MPIIGDSSALKPGERLIALAGHPNVGKSTVFNLLTGMHQHTGNWAGKTVVNAFGRYEKDGCRWLIADLPGCCSLDESSAEERTARDFICLEHPDVIVAVCSATALERGVSLVLQILELTGRVVVCVNLMDEARRKGINPDLGLLERKLGVPVVGTSARSGKGIERLKQCVKEMAEQSGQQPRSLIAYPAPIEAAVTRLAPDAGRVCSEGGSARWLALKSINSGGSEYLSGSGMEKDMFSRRLGECLESLGNQGFDRQRIGDAFSRAVSESAQRICSGVVPPADSWYSERDRRLDRILTGRVSGWLVMAVLLAVVLWITLEGANYLSGWLSIGFNRAEELLHGLCVRVGMPEFWRGLLLSGAFRVLGWVVSVMLPPMAIFFPLFTMLEDAGYLPRAAFNLDGGFRRCGACGKQALTMCMGLGCNAAGVVGCRIIASPRERLIAVLTNSFVPCNGRFPTMLTVIALFMAGSAGAIGSAAVLALFIALGAAMSMAASKLLASTVLRGQTSSFSLELPPFRRPDVGRTLVRSLIDRTARILGRAVAVSLPAGVVVWLLANVHAGDATLLSRMTELLEPLGKLMGLDGVMLTAFVLGFPANELVLPAAMMAYSAQGELMEIGSMESFGEILRANGWDWTTAVSMLLFTLMHAPCSTACITIYKETRSVKWTAVGVLLPVLCGFLCCVMFTAIVRFFA